jgi:hypothetical protein
VRARRTRRHHTSSSSRVPRRRPRFARNRVELRGDTGAASSRLNARSASSVETLLPPAHLVQPRRHVGPEERRRDEVLSSEQVETVGCQTGLDRCAGVAHDHGSAAFARAADGTDDVWHRLTGSSSAPCRGQATLNRRDERQQIRLFDEVLRPGAARPESARSDPTPDGLWVATNTAGGFRDGEHRSSRLQQMAGQDDLDERVAVDRFRGSAPVPQPGNRSTLRDTSSARHVEHCPSSSTFVVAISRTAA